MDRQKPGRTEPDSPPRPNSILSRMTDMAWSQPRRTTAIAQRLAHLRVGTAGQAGRRSRPPIAPSPPGRSCTRRIGRVSASSVALRSGAAPTPGRIPIRTTEPRARPSSSMEEQWTFNPLVQGSSPWGGTTRNQGVRCSGTLTHGGAHDAVPTQGPSVARWSLVGDVDVMRRGPGCAVLRAGA